MQIKLQVNSPEVLRRIVGDDDTLELNIRTALIESMRGQSLRDYVNSEALRNAIVSCLFDVTGSSYSPKYAMEEDMMKLVSKAVENSLTAFVTDQILNKTKAVEKINAFIEQKSSEICATFTSQEIQYRINEMVDLKIKQKLGLS